MNKTTKTIFTYAGIVLLLLVLAYAFVPQVLTGKIVNQSDITGYKSMAQETIQWNKSHPDNPARWTDAMFGGMPNTSFYPSSKGDWTQPLYRLLMKGKTPANWLFISLIGAFLLMLSLGIDKFLAAGGAVAVTFCSYNMQIIQVGHNTKMQALALLPWVLAAVIFTYRSALRKEGKGWLARTVLGVVLFGLALSFQIKANHQQITYYLALMVILLALTVFISLVCSKEGRRRLGRFFAASGLMLAVGLAGIGTNTIKLAPLYEYTRYTMRGGSELSHPSGGEINSQGLQLDYATAWSYGWEELPNLMIPNFNGGSSAGSIDPDKSAVIDYIKKEKLGNPEEYAKALPFYWGPQPFTAGPMYMGAITIFLFIMGLFLYKGKEKWWLLAATVLAVFLAVGNHMMWFTRLFFDYVPMYNKFRTVSMALVILQFTLPMLGFLVLDKILKNEYAKGDILRAVRISLAVTAGFCLLCWVFPGIAGSFTGASDSRLPDAVQEAFRADRRSLLVSDALVSMANIFLAAALILWAFKALKRKETEPGAEETPAAPEDNRGRRIIAAAGICLLILVNLFAVGKRYLNADHFTTKRQFNAYFNKRPVDKAIQEDPSPSYRVADLGSDIFNDNFNPFWHKCVGGYSPAKLQRYQDLIDRYLNKEFQSIYDSVKDATSIEELESLLPETKMLSALNTKYFIINGDVPPAVNKYAYGTAWFVDGFVEADTPDDEIGLLEGTDLRSTAIVGADFPEARARMKDLQAGRFSPEDAISMTSYSPDEVRYHYSAAADRPAVFSEVYYPKGWRAYIDASGKEVAVDLFRVDWILRGAVLPAGEHDIVMRFEPRVYSTGEKVSRASSVTLLLLLVLSVAGMVAARKKEEHS